MTFHRLRGGGQTNYDRIVMDSSNEEVYLIEAFETVDLGLPSGTLWATKNIGASKPSDLGLFFACGEDKGFTKEEIVVDKKRPFNSTQWVIRQKHRQEFQTMYTENNGIITEKFDNATLILGKNVQLPTVEQVQELIDNTYIGDSDYEKYIKLVSNSDSSKYLHIPVCNEVVGREIQDETYMYYIPTNKLGGTYSDWQMLEGYSDKYRTITTKKAYNGYTLRPVLKK